AATELAAGDLATRRGRAAAPLQRDRSFETAARGRTVRDWRAYGWAPVPGQDFPKLVVADRDYPNVAAKMAALGPLAERLGLTTKGVTFEPERAVEHLKGKNGVVRGGVPDRRAPRDLRVHARAARPALSLTPER